MTEPEERIDEQDPKPGDPAAAEAGGEAAGGPDAEADALARAEAQLRRSMADLANLRKRMHREVDEARRRALEGLTAELLPVLDNFHLALGVKDQQETGSGSFDPDAVVEGMRMVKSLLESVLERHGLSEIPADGCSFDPNLHEAVGVDTISDAAAGQVTQVVQRGYRIGDKVLRASRVLVRGEDPNAQEGG
jgi:molecular chaperone GrpE